MTHAAQQRNLTKDLASHVDIWQEPGKLAVQSGSALVIGGEGGELFYEKNANVVVIGQRLTIPGVKSTRTVPQNLAAAEPEGFVKILYGEPHGEIIGAHIIGSESTEMIAEIGLAMNLEATWDEIEATIHAHPTLSEMVKEATEVAKGHPIHV